jgi:hypothetical protein
VRVLARHRAKNAEGGGNGVAAAFDRELDDVLWIEIHRVRSKRCSGRMLDALIDRKDRHITSVGETSVTEHRLKVAQDLRRTI